MKLVWVLSESWRFPTFLLRITTPTVWIYTIVCIHDNFRKTSFSFFLWFVSSDYHQRFLETFQSRRCKDDVIPEFDSNYSVSSQDLAKNLELSPILAWSVSFENHVWYVCPKCACFPVAHPVVVSDSDGHSIWLKSQEGGLHQNTAGLCCLSWLVGQSGLVRV